MWATLGQIGICVVLVGAVSWLASRGASKSAQLEALKAELKKEAEEQNRVEKIINNVGNLSERDVRQRLHNIANKK